MITDENNWQYRGKWKELCKEKRFNWNDLEKHFSPPKQIKHDKIPRKLKKKIKSIIRKEYYKDLTTGLLLSWYRELTNPDHNRYLLKLSCQYTCNKKGEYIKIPPVKVTTEIKEKINTYFPEKRGFELFDETEEYFKKGVEWSDDGITMALRIPRDGKTFKRKE